MENFTFIPNMELNLSLYPCCLVLYLDCSKAWITSPQRSLGITSPSPLTRWWSLLSSLHSWTLQLHFHLTSLLSIHLFSNQHTTLLPKPALLPASSLNSGYAPCHSCIKLKSFIIEFSGPSDEHSGKLECMASYGVSTFVPSLQVV